MTEELARGILGYHLTQAHLAQSITPTSYIHLYVHIDDARHGIDSAREMGIPNVREVVVDVDGTEHEMTLDEFIRRVTE